MNKTERIQDLLNQKRIQALLTRLVKWQLITLDEKAQIEQSMQKS